MGEAEGRQRQEDPHDGLDCRLLSDAGDRGLGPAGARGQRQQPRPRRRRRGRDLRGEELAHREVGGRREPEAVPLGGALRRHHPPVHDFGHQPLHGCGERHLLHRLRGHPRHAARGAGLRRQPRDAARRGQVLGGEAPPGAPGVLPARSGIPHMQRHHLRDKGEVGLQPVLGGVRVLRQGGQWEGRQRAPAVADHHPELLPAGGRDLRSRRVHRGVRTDALRQRLGLAQLLQVDRLLLHPRRVHLRQEGTIRRRGGRDSGRREHEGGHRQAH
mmetsp:Transcript_24783/g.70759  ORF Transcript_24783/g.70759 Transcript_24783/m.70759 type:complete len:272 (+) Transcript_24783:211-1026(+)